ncbi:MAG: methyl-accepting chemotaxis protein [Geminicoccaceae bacterium]
MRETLETLLGGLQMMDEVRDKVDRLKLPKLAMLDYYSGLNADALQIVGLMTGRSSVGDISASLAAFEYFMLAKERAGLERAVVGGGLAKGRLNIEEMNRFSELINAQVTFLKLFSDHASATIRQSFDAIRDSEAARALERMRAVIRYGGLEGRFEGLTPGRWFETVTQRIDELKGVEMAIAAELDRQSRSAQHAAERELVRSVVLLALLFVFVTVATILVSGALSRALDRIREPMARLANDDFDFDLPPESDNEFGQMARALAHFKGAIRAKLEHTETLESLIFEFENETAQLMDRVSSTLTELEKTAAELSASADITDQRSDSVAVASREAAASVEAVAGATDELSGSIADIAGQIGRTAASAGEVVRYTDTSMATIAELADAAEDIGQVIGLIRTIAEQTNLLALNATIEAARAGDAGRGFAVVAAEVKALASQTAQATSDIAERISGIQKASLSTGEAMQSVDAKIRDIAATANQVASSIEQQKNVTGAIAASAQTAARNTHDASSHIAHVRSSATETRLSAQNVESMSRELAERAANLDRSFRNFLNRVPGRPELF